MQFGAMPGPVGAFLIEGVKVARLDTRTPDLPAALLSPNGEKAPPTSDSLLDIFIVEVCQITAPSRPPSSSS